MSGLHKHTRLVESGGMVPQEILEVTCSEIASEAILYGKPFVSKLSMQKLCCVLLQN